MIPDDVNMTVQWDEWLDRVRAEVLVKRHFRYAQSLQIDIRKWVQEQLGLEALAVWWDGDGLSVVTRGVMQHVTCSVGFTGEHNHDAGGGKG